METGTANLLHMLEDRVRELCHQERWDEALHAAETTVRKAREAGSGEPGAAAELALALEVQGDLLRQMERYEEGLRAYHEALELLDGREDQSEQVGRIGASTAVLHDALGNAGEAIAHYQKAIGIFQAMDPPAELDVADLSNNLAFLYEAEGDYDEAETLLLRALNITHDLLGKDDVETALVCNNLGTLYQKAGHYERAKDMHRMALDARISQCGENHPETGQSHANLAVALAETGKSAEAREHFEEAILILEKNLEEAAEDYETVALNYVQFLQSMGDEKGAVQVAKRSAKLLKKLLKR